MKKTSILSAGGAGACHAMQRRWGAKVMGALWAVSLVSGSAMAADNGKITFSGTIVAGTCSITVDPVLAFDDIDMNPLIDSNYKVLVSKNFPVTLSDCSGLPAPNKTPYIIVTSSSADGNKFKGGAGSTAVGPYFIINKSLRSSSVIVWNASSPWDSADTVSSGNGLRAEPSEQKSLFGNGTWYMSVAITCGEAADCKGTDMKPGDLEAPLTLAFEWK
ncbi:fimbrial protein [Serratia marcescens]|uniref:fimbrial protein n=1 Tax=Serratia marcescens TaxID=615 RepID=UPI0021780435|nr:hypothetical protein [Serratia marcescens]CAI1615704.1 P pilus assembly protein, pilin FimA [Serratia marcescens]